MCVWLELDFEVIFIFWYVGPTSCWNTVENNLILSARVGGGGGMDIMKTVSRVSGFYRRLSIGFYGKPP